MSTMDQQAYSPPPAGRIGKLFEEVPETYERTNHVLTLGLDVIWRRKAVRHALGGECLRTLDVCTGTGDMAFCLRRFGRPDMSISAVDFCEPMLQVAMRKPGSAGIRFLKAVADNLPFPDESFDLVTLSFAARNLNTDRDSFLKCLREFRRVIRPGGRFVCVETSQPRSRFLRRCFHAYIGLIVRPVGRWLSGSDHAYRYLAHTIPRFHDPDEFCEVLRTAGFAEASFVRMTFGIAAVHTAVVSSLSA